MSAWDGFFNDMDRAVSEDILRKQYDSALTAEAEKAAHWYKAYHEYLDYAAENVGVRSALTAQLKNYDPKNPLLTDESLVQRIKKEAVSAFRVAKLSFDASRDVGRTFIIPGREGPVAPPVAPVPAVTPFAAAALLASNPAAIPLNAVLGHPVHVELMHQYAGSLALRSALSEVLSQLAPDHPLIKDVMLQGDIRQAGVKAFVTSNRDYNAARSAGASFVLPGTPGAADTQKQQG